MMNTNKLVSIIIATYNAGHYLPQAVQSAINQTYANIEIHIVDDGSTDNSCEAMKIFLHDKRVNYHYQNNSGQAKAKNRGIRESRGDFIAFIDADDVWLPDKLEKQLPCFEKSSDIGVVYTKLAIIDNDGKELFVPQINHASGKITENLLIENVVTGMTSVVRKECFEKVGLFDENLPMAIDYDLWLRISLKYDFYYLDDVTYKYRLWQGQMSHNWRRRFECGKYIMERFIVANQNILNANIINEAWAHTYVSLGACYANIEKDKVKAFMSYLTALKYKYLYSLAWKHIIKLCMK